MQSYSEESVTKLVETLIPNVEVTAQEPAIAEIADLMTRFGLSPAQGGIFANGKYIKKDKVSCVLIIF